ncbi:hypothetical protein K492DRAFT_230185 [Lichtheimia hyalospora FSU 10163]|nr:hypothetical protein K492DRAFT_230185 [Lichtheimia hyalospora FSU 10163]
MPMIFRKPQPKTVAVDLDQTLAHTLEAMIDWHNQIYHTSLTMADFDTHDYSRVWGGSHEEACLKVREFYDSPHFERIQPIHDFALETLKILKKRKFTLVIITSRQQFIAEDTKKFVDKHYPGIFESIYFCNLGLSDAEQLEYVSKPKSAICQEIGVDVLIDDGLDHAIDCATSLDIEVLLYDRKNQYRWNHLNNKTTCGGNNRPVSLTAMSRQLYQNYNNNYNNTHLPSNITRVSSWKQILDYFPKPHSPLRNCHYPQDLMDDDDDDDDDYEDGPSCEYETIEVDGLTDDEDEYRSTGSSTEAED